MEKVHRSFWRAKPACDSQGLEKSASAKDLDTTLLSNERRVVNRHCFPLTGTVRYGLVEIGEPVSIADISHKGLRIHGNVRFPIGATIELVISLPKQLGFYGGQRVRYYASVIRVYENAHECRYETAAVIRRCETLATEESKPGDIHVPTQETKEGFALRSGTSIESLRLALPCSAGTGLGVLQAFCSKSHHSENSPGSL